MLVACSADALSAWHESAQFAVENNGPSAPPRLVRLMSYNIKAPALVDLPQVADVILDENPEVVCLQEVDHNAIRSGYVDQTEELATMTGLTHTLYAATGTYAEISQPPYVDTHPDGPQLYLDTIGASGYRGVAILSAHPVVWYNIIPFAGHIHPRALLLAIINANGREVGIVCTHFPTREAKRMPMVDWLNDHAPASRATFLLGDLNAEPGDVEIDTLETVWENPAASSPVLTFPASGPVKQIDYTMEINVDELSTSVRAGTALPNPSDHLPLVTDYFLP